MRIIEIAPLDNGAHRNQSYTGLHGYVPDGWAIVPGDLETENFPFGAVTVEDKNGVPIVTSWIPGIMPDPKPISEPETESSVWDELDAAYQEGVDSV